MGTQIRAVTTARKTTAWGSQSRPGKLPVERARSQCATAPPGALRIRSATPCQTKSIASVTTMSGTLETVMRVPLIAPIARPRRRTPRTISTDWPPEAPSMRTAPVTLAMDIIAAMERSMPPAITTIAIPTVARAKGNAARARLSRPEAPKSGWISLVVARSAASSTARPSVHVFASIQRFMSDLRNGCPPPPSPPHKGEGRRLGRMVR